MKLAVLFTIAMCTLFLLITPYSLIGFHWVQLIMAIELTWVQFGLINQKTVISIWNHKHDFRPKLHDTKFNYHFITPTLKSQVWFQTKIAWHEVQLPLHYTHFEITSMISDQNCTTRSSITTSLHPFWNHKYDFRPKLHDTKFNYHFITPILKSQVWFQTKIARHEVQLPLYYIHFEITSMISDQNCTTRSSITTLLHPLWNHKYDFRPKLHDTKFNYHFITSILKSQAWFQTKIAQHEVQLPLYYIHFEITSMISDQNCTTRSSITTLLHPFWNHKYDFRPKLHDTKFNYHFITSTLKSQVWFQTKIARHEVQLPLHYTHFEITGSFCQYWYFFIHLRKPGY